MFKWICSSTNRRQVQGLRRDLQKSGYKTDALGDECLREFITLWKRRADAQKPAPSVAEALSGTRAVEALGVILKHSDSFTGRSWAAQSLGGLGDVRAVVVLVTAIDGDIRESVIKSLRSFGELALEPLIQSLRDGAPHDASNAAVALGTLRFPEAMHPLLEALDNPYSDVRRNAATALGRIGKLEVSGRLMKMLTQDPDTSVRQSAATALGRIGDPEIIRPLEELLLDEYRMFETWARQSAANALGAIGNSKATRTLRTVLVTRDEDEEVREEARLALIKVGDESMIISILKNPNKYTKYVEQATAEACRRHIPFDAFTCQKCNGRGYERPGANWSGGPVAKCSFCGGVGRIPYTPR